jgi:hypothetical protein
MLRQQTRAKEFFTTINDKSTYNSLRPGERTNSYSTKNYVNGKPQQ